MAAAAAAVTTGRGAAPSAAATRPRRRQPKLYLYVLASCLVAPLLPPPSLSTCTTEALPHYMAAAPGIANASSSSSSSSSSFLSSYGYDSEPRASTSREEEEEEEEDYSREEGGEEDYEYYDYYDYGDGRVSGIQPLNMSLFRMPARVVPGHPNLQGNATTTTPEHHVPRYMLQLFADNHNHPTVVEAKAVPGQTQRLPYEVVRSFIPINTGNYSHSQGGGHLEKEEEEEASWGEESTTRVYRLVFNVSMRQSERIQAASLRLYTLIQRDQNNYVGVERLVRIKMATSSVFDNNVAGEEEGSPNVQLRTVCERNIYERENAWETFDVTSALKHWLDRPELVQVLQVYIESVFSTAGSGGRLDVATEPYTDSEPLLLVYSRGHHRKRHRAELHAMIDHEYDTAVRESDERRDRRKRSYTEEQEEMSNTIWSSELPPPKGHLKLRKKSKRSCKRKPMHVDFAAIGWDHWIIAPKGYQAYQCTGKCFYPLPSHLSPTKHAVVQNLVHSLHPETASRACCVPTELGPISLLYMEANVPTYKYNYDDMVVLKCGCR